MTQKTIYIVRDPDGVIVGTRQSARTYTHAVIVTDGKADASWGVYAFSGSRALAEKQTGGIVQGRIQVVPVEVCTDRAWFSIYNEVQIARGKLTDADTRVRRSEELYRERGTPDRIDRCWAYFNTQHGGLGCWNADYCLTQVPKLERRAAKAVAALARYEAGQYETIIH